MGGMSFPANTLADTLSETVGYKAGLALSVGQMCDVLAGTDWPELILDSEEDWVRLRSEEYEALFYRLLYKVGYTEEEFDGDLTGARLYHKYKGTHLQSVYEGVTRLYIEMWPQLIKDTVASGRTKLDPTPYANACKEQYGAVGFALAIERVDVVIRAQDLWPHSSTRYHEWGSVEQLSALFDNTSTTIEQGKFIDQRYLDFLCNNPDKIGNIHWRKFEELTAEYYERQGYQVELGPGGNDDGVDVRIWTLDADVLQAPHAIVQCKREKSKIEKVIVKGLYADVKFEKASIGLIVTSSELSPGARKTISVRGYPIREVNRHSIARWLKELRTPGTGIVRG